MHTPRARIPTSPRRHHTPPESTPTRGLTAPEAAPAVPSLDPIPSDADVLAHVTSLIGAACRRQLWVMLLDADDVPVPVLLPIEGLPATPTAEGARQMGEAIAAMAHSSGAASVLLTWERVGPRFATPGERRWAAALSGSCAANELPIRAQLIAHTHGVRLFPVTEFLTDRS